MKEVVCRMLKSEDLMKGFCAGVWSTAKAGMLLDENRELVGCDVDSKLVTAGETDLVLPFFSQVLGPKLKISSSAEVIAATMIFREGTAGLSASREDSAWEAPPGRAATKVLPAPKLNSISAMFEKYSLQEICRQLSLNVCWLAWRSPLARDESESSFGARKQRARNFFYGSPHHATSRTGIGCLLVKALGRSMW